MVIRDCVIATAGDPCNPVLKVLFFHQAYIVSEDDYGSSWVGSFAREKIGLYACAVTKRRLKREARQKAGILFHLNGHIRVIGNQMLLSRMFHVWKRVDWPLQNPTAGPTVLRSEVLNVERNPEDMYDHVPRYTE